MTADEGDVSGLFRFQLGRRNQLVLYKQKGESASHVRLKAAAYALFCRNVDNLQVAPRLDFKVQPDLAALNLRGEPEVWIQCQDSAIERLEYVCKHTPAREVVLVTEEPSTDDLVARLKKRIHYRYTARKLKLVNFHPPIEDWLDPQSLEVPPDAYDVFNF